MTITKNTRGFRLPDPPDREPDDMTSYRQLTATSIIEPLRHYLGNLDTTLITGDQYLIETFTRNLDGSRYPDLMIAFDCRPGIPPEQQRLHHRRTGQAPRFRPGNSLPQHRPRGCWATSAAITPAWASRNTGGFDETPTGRWHGARLAGDLLAKRPIPTHPHRTAARRRTARLQPDAERTPALGKRATALARPGYRPSHRHFRR